MPLAITYIVLYSKLKFLIQKEMFLFHFNSDMNVAYLSSVFYNFKSATSFIV